MYCMILPDVRKADVSGKNVFLRADYDIPLFNSGEIEDDTRLVAGLSTITYLLEHGATVIIGSKLGRPWGVDTKLSFLPVALWLKKKCGIGDAFSMQETTIGGFAGWQVTPKLLLLENLQFYREEKENNPEFAQKLASLASVYVNDSFAVSHRNNASIVGVPSLLPHYAGIHFQEEVAVLSSILENPKRPLVVIIGGAKIETKLPLVEKMHRLADYMLVGGKIAGETGELLRVQHEKIPDRKSVLFVADLNSDGTDITEKSRENFLQVIALANTIVWNGPVGKVEEVVKGTEAIAQGIVASGAYSVVGGGDTLAAIKKFGLLEKFSFASTGGGAMLAFLSGEDLPGITALLR